ncbi:hypothetical protein PR048_000969 [Dryococelus australis]|uniref:Uncharacterized protein n=1 Tax=Dryococelus australis TaxID=614101 RepID=A0ABQ9IG26_9NEOP|nr:hypothetical protein PR048_000969 [Dryococelus australis]
MEGAGSLTETTQGRTKVWVNNLVIIEKLNDKILLCLDVSDLNNSILSAILYPSPHHTYRYLSLSYGTNNAPELFQNLVKSTFWIFQILSSILMISNPWGKPKKFMIKLYIRLLRGLEKETLNLTKRSSSISYQLSASIMKNPDRV